ncbi:hypothetical protein WN944_001170 [Citrus x changshan-huyou]|uniref:Uncharacterized protein n=1 Tax=Citrus x changshan-huyou TaxID=2935761 RepID=A0AAP0QR43_9ROSI
MLGCIGTTAHTSETSLDSFQFDKGHALDLTPIPREEGEFIQYAFDKDGNGSEIIVSIDDQFISRHNFMSLLPNTALSGEILTMIAHHLTLCERAKHSDALIN